jgi:hypothetical protein
MLRDAARRIWRGWWAVTLRSWVLSAAVLLALAPPARAHDLAIDQLMLWPDRSRGELRGELTFDPELTRSKDAQPSEADARRAVEFLNAHLDVTLDGERVPLAFEVRELWVRGGATLGDVVRFSAPLAAAARELRVRGSGFEALVVSVQQMRGAAAPGGPAPGALGPAAGSAASIETTSWLLGKDESTPVYDLDAGWREPGWKRGGPDAFNDPSAAPAVGEAAGSPAGAPESAGAPASGSERASATSLAARFVRLGFEHILPGGVDHVLFVAGLVLARSRRFRQVLVSLSLFTLAHTLTLALGHFQLLQLSPRVVEPLIAFSIFVLGIDNLRASRSAEAPAGGRHLVVFCFGLVHGLGFASALSELSFDPDRLVLALLSFNLGVELGQVVVVSLLALALFSIRRWRELEQYATLAGSAAIAASGLVLAIDRVTHTDSAAFTSARSAPADSFLAESPTPAVDRPHRNEL